MFERRGDDIVGSREIAPPAVHHRSDSALAVPTGLDHS